MRLWHYTLLPYLPRLQLISQWRECCCIAKNIAEKGTPNHVLVNRILDYPMRHFVAYSGLVYHTMIFRGYKADEYKFLRHTDYVTLYIGVSNLFEGWHDDIYLRECLYNLEEKARAGAIPADEWQIIYKRFKDFTPLWEGAT